MNKEKILARKQKELDKRKWKLSEKAETDLSGKMTYCYFCPYRIVTSCAATQEHREKETLCAVAWCNKNGK